MATPAGDEEKVRQLGGLLVVRWPVVCVVECGWTGLWRLASPDSQRRWDCLSMHNVWCIVCVWCVARRRCDMKYGV